MDPIYTLDLEFVSPSAASNVFSATSARAGLKSTRLYLYCVRLHRRGLEIVNYAMNASLRGRQTKKHSDGNWNIGL